LRLPFLSSKHDRGGDSVSTAPEERLRSRAFAAAVEDLGRISRCRVLDLGAARGENVEFFSGVGCTLEILDLYPQLTERPDRLSRTHESFAIGELVGSILRQRPGQEAERQEFDLLLAWDLFDFLAPEQIRGLVEGLEPWIRSGSRLLSRVSYLGTVPSEPRQVRVLDSETLLVTTSTAGRRSSPRYTEPQLLKVMPGWEVDQCFLQRDGFREYLFVRR